MSRHMKIAAAQLGPIHLADTREAVVKRLVALMREAHARARASSSFPSSRSPRSFRAGGWRIRPRSTSVSSSATMPSAVTQPLFDEGKRLGVGYYIGYGELTQEGGSFVASIPRSSSVPTEKSSASTARSICPATPTTNRDAPFQHLEKKYFEVGDLGFRVWRFMDTITGMLICNDRRWPEAFRVLALQGAEIVALGFNTPTENLHYPEPPALRVHHHLIMAQAMAFQNATWLVETAKCGVEDGFRMFGHSLIVATDRRDRREDHDRRGRSDLLQLRHRPRAETEARRCSTSPRTAGPSITSSSSSAWARR